MTLTYTVGLQAIGKKFSALRADDEQTVILHYVLAIIKTDQSKLNSYSEWPLVRQYILHFCINFYSQLQVHGAEGVISNWKSGTLNTEAGLPLGGLGTVA